MATYGLKEMGKFHWNIGKMEGKEKALEGKITKYPVVPSEIGTHDLLLTRREL